MGLPQIDITNATADELAEAYHHAKFGRVVMFRGRQFDDLDLNDMREALRWAIGRLASHMREGVDADPGPIAQPMPEEPTPEPEKKTSGAKGKK